ncbi:CLUMA_CG006266, isoform A [Clunio marinus]|uniref:CLUMA_CG006266, isoform A n=1 Tax=Clunio marinus TaxID=568069 RepID=A0A1J1HY04_9DIPT|nr:CLUMA_CG006266, isoform A [Clunio marinus]
MPRRRKLPVTDKENEKHDESEKMNHSDFMDAFSRCLSLFLIREGINENVPRMFKFFGMFIARFDEKYDEHGGTHILIANTFKHILSITSKDSQIRARICLLVASIMNSFSQTAELDDGIMEAIVDRMLTTFIRDVAPIVRQNALMALQRLQDPENPDDQVTKAYIYHMESDQASKVRQTAITMIAKKLPVFPHIFERFQDIDEKVRRHTYLQMSSFPVKSYKIADRIKILTAGLNDRSEMVKKTVHNILLPNWIASYNDNYAEFAKALKFDSNDDELLKFRVLAEDALAVVFTKKKVSDLVNFLDLQTGETAHRNCLSIEKSNSLEWLIIWKMILEFHQDYIEKSSNHQEKEDDGKESSDNIGCKKLQELLKKILMEHEVSEVTIKKITNIMELIVPSVDTRLTLFNNIIIDMMNLGQQNEIGRQEIIEQLISKADINTQVKANSLKMEMMELKEQERNSVERKQYADAQKASESYIKLKEKLLELLHPIAESLNSSQMLLESLSSVITTKTVKAPEILKNLQIIYFALNSNGVRALTPGILKTYNDFVRYHLESTDTMTRIWALNTATACSLLYESLSKDVYVVLKAQMFKSDNVLLWEASIHCIIDLILRYSMEKMENFNANNENNLSQESHSRSKRSGRTLYTDDGEEAEEIDLVTSVEFVKMLTHVMDNNVDHRIQKATIIGLCKLILHGQYCTRDTVSKLLLAYFNPATEAEINQILGIFFESIIKRKKQEILYESLIPTLITLLEAPYDSPLREIKQDVVLKYVISASRPIFCSNGLNLHNTIGLKLIELMKENPENKDIIKVISKELQTLEISEDQLLQSGMATQLELLLSSISVDAITKKNLADFRDMLKGTYKAPLKFSSTAATAASNIDEDAGISEDENEEPVELPEEDEDEVIQDENEEAVELPDEDRENNVIPDEDEEGKKAADSTNHSNVSSKSESQQELENDLPQVEQETSEVQQESVNESNNSVEHDNVTRQDESEVKEDSVNYSESSDEEAEETVKTIVLPETPEISTPTRSSRLASKRLLNSAKSLNSSVSSPIHKIPRNEDVSTPKSRFSILSESKVSTPKSDRQTRQKAKEDSIQQIVLTRSASKKINVDPIEVTSKFAAAGRSKSSSATSRQQPLATKRQMSSKLSASASALNNATANANTKKVTKAKSSSSAIPKPTFRQNPNKKPSAPKERPRWK